MAIDRATFLEIVKDAYSAYYTILPVGEGEEELPLAFRAEYKVRDEQYFFVKSANIWSNEKYEYCFVFSAPSFDAALVEKCMDFWRCSRRSNPTSSTSTPTARSS